MCELFTNYNHRKSIAIVSYNLTILSKLTLYSPDITSETISMKFVLPRQYNPQQNDHWHSVKVRRVHITTAAVEKTVTLVDNSILK